MTVVRAAAPIIFVGVVLSAAVTLVGGLWFLKAEELVGTDKDWVRPEGAFAMAFFALMVGLLTTVASAILARWFPLGLFGVAAVAIGFGIYVSFVALDQKPALAGEFIVLHAVFVVAFGLLLPYRLFVSQPGRRLSLLAPSRG